MNASGCHKRVSETNGYVKTAIERPTYLATLMSVQRIVFRFPLTLQMTVMHKLKFMQDFYFYHQNRAPT